MKITFQTWIFGLLNLSFIGYVAGIFWLGETVELLFMPLFFGLLILAGLYYIRILNSYYFNNSFLKASSQIIYTIFCIGIILFILYQKGISF